MAILQYMLKSSVFKNSNSVGAAISYPFLKVWSAVTNNDSSLFKSNLVAGYLLILQY